MLLDAGDSATVGVEADVGTPVVADATVSSPARVACPTITSLAAVPNELLGSQPSQLEVTFAPANAKAQWSVSPGDGGGVFSPSPSVPAPMFMCECYAGVPITIGVTVTLPDGETCDGSGSVAMTIPIDCESGGLAPCVGDLTSCEPPGWSCAGPCFDLRTDRAHCGACGRACEPGETCDDGGCTSAPRGDAGP
jgi:hypothetical protein